MSEVVECLLELNKTLMMNMYQADYTLQFGDSDFVRFVTDIEKKFPKRIEYGPDKPSLLAECNWVKLAGPGSYIRIERKP